MPPDSENPGLHRVHYQLRATGIKDPNANPLRSGIHGRGYLPHVKHEGAEYFLTFRLGDSLPQEVLRRFESECAERIRFAREATPRRRSAGPDEQLAKRQLRQKIERYLDQGVGACHLARPEIAELVAGSLQFFHQERYLLHEWVVMPNHVHAMVWPMPNYLLSNILKSWKQFTGLRANRILGKEGKRFWQPESYDHWIRSDEERSNISRYIRDNPVAAGLCARPEDWRWSSAWSPSRSADC